MNVMSDSDAARFVAALDKVDVALLAIRMEFEELARQSAERLAAIKPREQGDNLSFCSERHEAAPA